MKPLIMRMQAQGKGQVNGQDRYFVLCQTCNPKEMAKKIAKTAEGPEAMPSRNWLISAGGARISSAKLCPLVKVVVGNRTHKFDASLQILRDLSSADFHGVEYNPVQVRSDQCAATRVLQSFMGRRSVEIGARDRILE